MDQRFSLQGKVAVVTGANGTFGSEFCRTFAEAGADIVLATTGIAGPGGGSREKPVGLVYVAVADHSGVQVEKLQLTGSRERIRSLSALRALDMIRRAAKQA